jgi:cell division protein FtsA
VDGLDGVANPVGLLGEHLEVEAHLVTGATTLIRNVTRSVERAGVQTEMVVLEPIATSLAVLTEDERQIGCAILDIGGGTTDISIFHDGAICHTAALPVAGGHLTYDLSVGMRLSRGDAERVKLDSGSARIESVAEDEYVDIQRLGDDEPHAFPRRLLAEILQPRMEQILGLVAREVERCGKPLLASGVVLSGGGAMLEDVVELTAEVLQMPARLGKPRPLGGLGDTLTHPSYATGVGLLLYGAERRPVPVRSLGRSADSLALSVWDQVTRLLFGSRRRRRGRR